MGRRFQQGSGLEDYYQHQADQEPLGSRIHQEVRLDRCRIIARVAPSVERQRR